MDYLVKRVFKDGRDAELIEDGLTREEAKAMVQEDIENGDSSVSMLVFDSE